MQVVVVIPCKMVMDTGKHILSVYGLTATACNLG